jgi:hypothetical protein
LTTWQEDVPWSVLLVTNVSFYLEKAKHRAHRGVAGRIWNVLEHLGRGRAAAPIDDIHDLSLAATQARPVFRHDNLVVLKN